MKGLLKFVRNIFLFVIIVLAIRGCLSLIKEREQKKDAIYVMKLEETIFSSEKIISEIRKIKKAKEIKAVIIRINSPGGTIGASQEIYHELLKFKEETGKKLVCSIENIGASGAYYVSLACDKVLALPGSIVGSIGVISIFFTVEELMKEVKIKPFIIKSGKFKDTGSPFRTPNEIDINYLQDVVMKLYNNFKEDVVKKRPQLKDKIDEIADGRVFTGKEAFELGLIDKLGSFSDAVSTAIELAQIKEEPKIIWPKKREFPFLEELMQKIKAEILSKLFSPTFM
ncbi:Putative signal peptide peptidase SppA [bacterium HR19]|nr:Putative signal peptide peptidase SppA [bacterium HR19]